MPLASRIVNDAPLRPNPRPPLGRIRVGIAGAWLGRPLVGGGWMALCGLLVGCAAGQAAGGLEPPPGTLEGLVLTPSSMSLDAGEVQQFSATGRLGDGSSAAVTVRFTTTGGTITPDGLYTAPARSGIFLVIATATDTNLADTASVTVSPPSNVAPWLVEDFSTYHSTVEMLQDPRGIYSTGEDVATDKMSLDTSTGYGALTQSMRYTWPAQPQECHDNTIGRNIDLPEAVTELWVEVWAMFAANFSTEVPACSSVSGSAYKFLFGRINGMNSRYHIVVGVQGNIITGYPTNEDAQSVPMNQYRIFDGHWHRYRFHWKVAVGGSNGAMEAWIDGRKIANKVNVSTGTTTSIYGIALGRNMNQGPILSTSLWWGSIKAFRDNPGW